MSPAAQLESGPLHEVEEATITGSTHAANVEKVNLMVEIAPSKSFTGNQNYRKERSAYKG